VSVLTSRPSDYSKSTATLAHCMRMGHHSENDNALLLRTLRNDQIERVRVPSSTPLPRRFPTTSLAPRSASPSTSPRLCLAHPVTCCQPVPPRRHRRQHRSSKECLDRIAAPALGSNVIQLPTVQVTIETLRRRLASFQGAASEMSVEDNGLNFLATHPLSVTAPSRTVKERLLSHARRQPLLATITGSVVE
jgi:hypothetical protein